ncbi:MAG: hypothetical protein JRD68_03125, partial [Deltaproteobacteria bacterium]|nr:hypothetical protein [Deltaproteobacteria bacterium]
MRKVSLIFLVLTFLAAMVGTASAATYYLRAESYTMNMPDGTTVTMWGFAQDTGFEVGDGVLSVPGPVLTVPPGDASLTIYLENNLPVPISIIIPGQSTILAPVTFTDGQGRERVRSFTTETPANNTTAGEYTWTGLKPGTFLYQSGTHPAVQVQMGLYGAMTKVDVAGQAYDGSTTYDKEVVLLYSEVDPALHSAVATGNYGPGLAMTSTIDYHPKYFLVTGSNSISGEITVLTGDRVLVRFLNAGLMTRVPVLLGSYLQLIARDGNLATYFQDRYSLRLTAGKTMDAIILATANETLYVSDRRSYVSLGATSNVALLSASNNNSAVGVLASSLTASQNQASTGSGGGCFIS